MKVFLVNSFNAKRYVHAALSLVYEMASLMHDCCFIIVILIALTKNPASAAFAAGRLAGGGVSICHL